MARQRQVHKSVGLSYGEQAAMVDVGIAPLVLFAWQRGMRTFASCEGSRTEFPYLAFVTARDAHRFYSILCRVGNTYARRFDDASDPFMVSLETAWFDRPLHTVRIMPKDVLPGLIEALETLFPLKDKADA